MIENVHEAGLLRNAAEVENKRLPDDSGITKKLKLPGDSGGIKKLRLPDDSGMKRVSREGFEGGKNKEVQSPRHISTINEGLSGQKHPDANVEYRKRTFSLDGEKVEGTFPVFESKADVHLPKDLQKSSDTEQFKYCTDKLAQRIKNNPELAKQFTPRQLEQIKDGAPRISGLTWHHHEIPGKMQLVDANAHSICRHSGGRSIWGGGSDCR